MFVKLAGGSASASAREWAMSVPRFQVANSQQKQDISTAAQECGQIG
jgi:hypothetical protein